MGSEEKLIWEYLDGTLSTKEKAKVKLRIESDSSFRSLYKNQEKLHKGLQSIETQKAPDFILSNIMVGIKNEAIYQAMTTKFTGLKYFSVLFITLNLIIVLWAATTSSVTRGSNTLDGKLQALYEPFATYDFAQAIPQPSQQMMLYGVTIALLLILFWGDFILNRLRTIKSR